jgi:hypothetical protein
MDKSNGFNRFLGSVYRNGRRWHEDEPCGAGIAQQRVPRSGTLLTGLLLTSRS